MTLDPNACGEVVLRVLSQMAFCFGEHAEDPEPPPERAILASVTFSAAELAGQVVLAAGEDLCRELTASFLGIEGSDGISLDSVRDGLGEIANVVASHLLAPDASTIEDYVLEPPIVSNIAASAWTDLLARSGVVCLIVDGAPMLAHLTAAPTA